ncbi:MAG: nucleoside deaminase [Bacteroidales bacterium]|nr:nucleoside deaminase [Bacteroidales bacterium]
MARNDHEHFMRLAIDLARLNLSSGHGGPFGALVVKDGEVIAAASNEVLLTHDPTAHAEIVAIRRACEHLGSYQLDGCVVYTSCEPCPMCLGAIYWARPDAVYYAGTREDAAQAGFDDEHIYSEIELPPIQRKIPARELLRAEAREVFNLWLGLDGRTLY